VGRGARDGGIEGDGRGWKGMAKINREGARCTWPFIAAVKSHYPSARPALKIKTRRPLNRLPSPPFFYGPKSRRRLLLYKASRCIPRSIYNRLAADFQGKRKNARINRPWNSLEQSVPPDRVLPTRAITAHFNRRRLEASEHLVPFLPSPLTSLSLSLSPSQRLSLAAPPLVPVTSAQTH
jgi:hypothetical protein